MPFGDSNPSGMSQLRDNKKFKATTPKLGVVEYINLRSTATDSAEAGHLGLSSPSHTAAKVIGRMCRPSCCHHKLLSKLRSGVIKPDSSNRFTFW